QVVNVGHIFHQTLVADLVDQRFSHPFNVHHRAGGKVQDALAQLGWAVGVDTAMVSLAFHAHYMAAAHRAMLGYMKRLMSARMLFIVDHFDDLGNHIAAALHHDPVANHHAQSLNFILVVERGAGDGRPSDWDRLKSSDRSEFT